MTFNYQPRNASNIKPMTFIQSPLNMNSSSKHLLFAFVGCLISLFVGNLQAQSHYPGQHMDKMVVSDKATPKVLSFDLKAVKLLESPFLENQKREEKWLLSLDNKIGRAHV